MRILILNWRDIKNPAKGGAEVLTHEVAKRWVKRGNSVIQFSAYYKGGKREEVIDGVKIIRRGRWWTVHLWAFLYYILRFRKWADVIVDEVHWFPFFSILYARDKTVLLACEVATECFFKYFPYPLALFWRIVEKLYLYLYKDIKAIAISSSTKEELVKQGFDRKSVEVLPMGLTIPDNIYTSSKEDKPTLVFLGRMNKLKGVDDAVEVFSFIKETFPQSKLWFIGVGFSAYIDKVKQKIAKYRIKKSVVFFGGVSDEEKFELLSRAHILIVPSIHEGWGLVVPEAGLVGTPAVAYNVAGLKEVIDDRTTGLLVEPNPKAMTKAVVRLFQDRKLLAFLGKNAKTRAKKHSWDDTARAALLFIQKYKSL